MLNTKMGTGVRRAGPQSRSDSPPAEPAASHPHVAPRVHEHPGKPVAPALGCRVAPLGLLAPTSSKPGSAAGLWESTPESPAASRPTDGGIRPGQLGGAGRGHGHQGLCLPQLCVQDNYRNNPFHNFRHCFCVAQMMYSMVWLCGLQVGPFRGAGTTLGGRAPRSGRGPHLRPARSAPSWGHCSARGAGPPPAPAPGSSSSSTAPTHSAGEVFPNGHLDSNDGRHLPRFGPPGVQQHVCT